MTFNICLSLLLFVMIFIDFRYRKYPETLRKRSCSVLTASGMVYMILVQFPWAKKSPRGGAAEFGRFSSGPSRTHRIVY